jgi:hypothetical protein
MIRAPMLSNLGELHKLSRYMSDGHPTSYIQSFPWFGVFTLHLVVAYPLPSIRLAPSTERQRFNSYISFEPLRSIYFPLPV